MLIQTTPQDTFLSPTLAVGTVTTWAGPTRVTATERGVRQVWLPDWHAAPPAQTSAQPQTAVVQTGTDAAARHLHQALDELAAYFAGDLRAFSVALDVQGPAFFQTVWAAVARVPYGATRAYGAIARELDAPEASRAVGAANGANPFAPFVPCHRIIAADGRLRDYGPGLPLKHRLLVMEGALPADAADYGAWVARIGDGKPVWLGVRAAGVACRPTCARPRRAWDRVHVVFRSLAAAQRAGFRPCPLCAPKRPTLLDEEQGA
jgi:methylated-DNA-[protein]-cysteine S-methyltransferase